MNAVRRFFIPLPEGEPPGLLSRIVLMGAGAVHLVVLTRVMTQLGEEAPAFVALALTCACVVTLALAWRRPLLAVLLTSTVVVSAAFAGIASAYLFLLFAAVYVLVVREADGPRLGGVAVSLIALVGVSSIDYGEVPWTNILIPTVMIEALAVVLALIGRARRDKQRFERERAVHTHERAVIASERDAARAQARIATELHDSVGHDLTAIIALSEGLKDTGESAEFNEAIDLINTLAREGLDATRQVVTSLSEPLEKSSPERDSPAPRSLGDAPRFSSAPGDTAATDEGGAAGGQGVRVRGDVERARSWEELDALIGRVRQTGLIVVVTETGVRPAVSEVVNDVYIIVREGLTNVMRHGQEASRVSVALDYASEQVAVTITDNGRGVSVPSPLSQAQVGLPIGVHKGGHGLAGLRRRVEARGGRLSAGPHVEYAAGVATAPLVGHADYDPQTADEGRHATDQVGDVQGWRLYAHIPYDCVASAPSPRFSGASCGTSVNSERPLEPEAP